MPNGPSTSNQPDPTVLSTDRVGRFEYVNRPDDVVSVGNTGAGGTRPPSISNQPLRAVSLLPTTDWVTAILGIARAWLQRQVAGPGEDCLDEGDCRVCGHPKGEGHEPTDPCGIIAALADALEERT